MLGTGSKKAGNRPVRIDLDVATEAQPDEAPELARLKSQAAEQRQVNQRRSPLRTAACAGMARVTGGSMHRGGV